MSDTDRITTRFPPALLKALRTKAGEVGMTDVEIVRLAVASFLAKEDALGEYLDAIDVLDKKMVIMLSRQEQFTRAIGNASLAANENCTPENRQKLQDRITQIIESIE